MTAPLSSSSSSSSPPFAAGSSTPASSLSFSSSSSSSSSNLEGVALGALENVEKQLREKVGELRGLVVPRSAFPPAGASSSSAQPSETFVIGAVADVVSAKTEASIEKENHSKGVVDALVKRCKSEGEAWKKLTSGVQGLFARHEPGPEDSLEDFLGKENGLVQEFRKDIGYSPDPLLDPLIRTEGQLVKAIKANLNTVSSSSSSAESHEAVATVEEYLIVAGYEKEELGVIRPDGEKQIFTLWRAPSGCKRLFMDHATWKVRDVLIPKLKGAAPQDPTSCKNMTTNLKVCTSLAKSTDPSFCGADGALVYLAPINSGAIVAAASHDVASPSETYQGHSA